MPSGCLTEKGLFLFIHGQLSAEEADTVRGHLQACELCAAATEGYSSEDPEAFSVDLSILNSGIAGLFFNEEKIQETALSDESRFEGARSPELSHVEIKRLSEGKEAKTFSVESTPPEREPMPAGIQITKTIIQRYQYRLLAAVILLLAGFGSILLYLQFKHSAINNNTAALIEKSDTISRKLTSIGRVADKKVFSEKKIQPGYTSSMEKDSGKVITVNSDNGTKALGYANHPVAGLIDRSSYPNREENGIAPSRGMPRAATPEAPKSSGNQKIPAVIANFSSGLPIETTENEDIETLMSNMDEKVSKGTQMKSITAEEEIPEAEVFTIVEESPQYPGGDEMRIKFLQENIKYPQAAREASINGSVYLTFVVEIDGFITEVRVLKGIGGGCDEEAVRVIKLMPKWIPGKQRGKPVRVQYNLAVQFKLAG
ncbi:MAG: TonB family protein [Bacteroidota bacterium]